jgi:hypothetical protein
MSLRSALVAVIALATVAFVIGTAIERNSGEAHRAEKSGERPTGIRGRRLRPRSPTAS